MSFPTQRSRRLRRSALLRDAVAETRFSLSQLIQPVFVHESGGVREEIPSMPGQYRYTVEGAVEYCATLLDLGIRSVLLFGIPAHKDAVGSSAFDDSGIVQRAVRELKSRFGGDLLVITDVCRCEYTDHGHCGVISGETVDNDKTLPVLARTALSHAAAGADLIAPSDMMDGRIAAIRRGLDDEGFLDLPILSYAVKYSSAFYGPFRDAAESAPQFGDRRAYQMNPANWREALKEARQDIEEGADLIMVKPGLPYLDVITRVRAEVDVPLVAYSVSGEYSMIRAAAQNGWLDEDSVVDESTTALFRAGSDLVISYFSESIARRRR